MKILNRIASAKSLSPNGATVADSGDSNVYISFEKHLFMASAEQLCLIGSLHMESCGTGSCLTSSHACGTHSQKIVFMDYLIL